MVETYRIMAIMEHTVAYVRQRWPMAHDLIFLEVTNVSYLDMGRINEPEPALCINLFIALSASSIASVDNVTTTTPINSLIENLNNDTIMCRNLDSYERNIDQWYYGRMPHNRSNDFPYISTWFDIQLWPGINFRDSNGAFVGDIGNLHVEIRARLIERWLRQYEADKLAPTIEGLRRLPLPISQAIIVYC